MGLFNRNKDAATTATAAPAASSATAAVTGDYTVDTGHSTLGFTARHAMVTNVKGSFTDFEGILHLDGTDPTRSTASFDVQVASITTGSEDRDNHLRTAEFFDVEKHPTMTFRSTRSEALGGDSYRITGDLTLLGTTRPLTIDLEFNGAAKDPMGNDRVGFEGTAELLRSDFGLSWNAALETGGVLVSDKIKLNFDISAIQKA